ncbi:MAG: histidine phosphatase family protein [Ferruginibacter sp.]
MKRIYMVRHAKSSWGEFGLPDFDRPLNERGKKDAPEMARRLLQKNVKIDQFISSPAKRARNTCKAFCEVFNYAEENILFIDELYHAPAATFRQVIKNISDVYESVAIFSHNPGITDFVNSLVENVSIDNMPTCAVFAVSSEAGSWADFFTAERSFLLVDYPKLGL